MRRSKENVIYYAQRMEDLFNRDEKYKSIKYHYDAIKLLIQKLHPQIKDHDNIQMLKDIVYLDRELRRATEGLEKEEKQILEEEYLLENGYSPDYQGQLLKLKTL